MVLPQYYCTPKWQSEMTDKPHNIQTDRQTMWSNLVVKLSPNVEDVKRMRQQDIMMQRKLSSATDGDCISLSSVWSNITATTDSKAFTLMCTLCTTSLEFYCSLTDLYLWKKTWYRQLGMCIGNYTRSPTLSQNDMNFGSQTA